MGQWGELIAAGAAVGKLYSERLLIDVTSETYARLARPGGETIRSNHPAFILGHLSLYPSRVMTQLGEELGETAAPEGWQAMFEPGAVCRDDPDGSIYPPLEALKSRYYASYAAAKDAIAQCDDGRLQDEHDIDGPLRELFPRIGMALNFYLVGHVQVHLGQLSAWRRAMGLPPA